MPKYKRLTVNSPNLNSSEVHYPPIPEDFVKLPRPYYLTWSSHSRGFITYKGKRVQSYLDLPAIVCYHLSSDVIKSKQWVKNDMMHRENHLPAFVRYDDSGNMMQEEYFIEGEKYDPSFLEINLSVLKEIL